MTHRLVFGVSIISLLISSTLGAIYFFKIQCKPRLLRRAQSRWGFQRGEAAALPFGRTRGFKPRVRYNLISESWVIWAQQSFLWTGLFAGGVGHVLKLHEKRILKLEKQISKSESV